MFGARFPAQSAQSSQQQSSSNKDTKSSINQRKLEDQLDEIWKSYSLDAPRIPNPIPEQTLGLRQLCLIVHLLLALTKIVIGARFLRDCFTNSWVPNYLLVGGLLQLCFLIMLIYRPLRQKVVLGALGIAILTWISIASVNIFVEWKPDFFLGGWRYCNKFLFYFAFFVSVSEYIIFSILILYVCTQLSYTQDDVDVHVV